MSTLEIKSKIQVGFIHTPPYSPDFNLAEYIIHLLRLRFLHDKPAIARKRELFPRPLGPTISNPCFG